MIHKKQSNQFKLLFRYLGFALLLTSVTLVFDACNSLHKTGDKPQASKNVKSPVKDTDPSDKHLDKNDNIFDNVVIIEEGDQPGDNGVDFIFIKNPPVYPGCEIAADQKRCMSHKIQEFVGKNFNTGLADSLKLNGQTVKILTMFTIDEKGLVTNIHTRSKYKVLEMEAKRVISKLPKMKPGQHQNRPVKVNYTLPIIFKVERANDFKNKK